MQIREIKFKFIIINILFLIPLIVSVNLNDPDKLEITKTEDIFTVHLNEDVPNIDINNWNVSLTGAIENELTFSYTDFLALPHTSIDATLRCVEGYYAYATWSGVTLETILELITPNATILDIAFIGADGYSSSLSLDDIDTSQVILATKVNNVNLTPELGYPLRIVAPGHYGYKWVMWITEIQFVSSDYIGFWESRGWPDNAQYNEPNNRVIITDWRIHAILLSTAFYFGCFSWLLGMKPRFVENSTLSYPKLFKRKAHIISGMIYGILSLCTTGLWIYRSILLKGNLSWKFHAITAVISTIFLLLSIPTLMWRKKHHQDFFKYNRHSILTTLSLLFMGLTILSSISFF